MKFQGEKKNPPQKVPAGEVVLFKSLVTFGGETWALNMLIGSD